MRNQNNGIYVRLLITGLVMFNFAICFIAYTMYFPENGLPFSSSINITIYILYVVIMLGCLLAAFSIGKKK